MRAILAAAVLLLLPAAAAAQVPLQCGQRDALAAGLAAEHGEHAVGRGVNFAGNLVELFRSADGNTWTLLVTMPDGPACIATHGATWEAVEPPPPGSPS